MRKQFWKGLRTIDLVIILSIICTVVAVVASRYDHFKCRAMQSEAKFSLQEIYAAQKAYHSKYNHYAAIKALVGQDKRVVLPAKYYTFADLIEPTYNSFSVGAVGVNGVLVTGEQWAVNQDHEIVLTKAVCKSK